MITKELKEFSNKFALGPGQEYEPPRVVYFKNFLIEKQLQQMGYVYKRPCGTFILTFIVDIGLYKKLNFIPEEAMFLSLTLTIENQASQKTLFKTLGILETID